MLEMKESSIGLDLNDFSNNTTTSNTLNSSVSMITDEDSTFSFEDIPLNSFVHSFQIWNRSTTIFDQLQNPDLAFSGSTSVSVEYKMNDASIPISNILSNSFDQSDASSKYQAEYIYTPIYDIDDHYELDFTKLLQIKVQSPEESSWNEIYDMFDELVQLNKPNNYSVKNTVHNNFILDNFSDVSLIVDGKYYQSYKWILSWRSEYFKNMFQYE